MKRLIAIAWGLLILLSASEAQYSVNKTRYDYRTYSFQVGDPYNPGVMSLASAIIPGLGELFEGESGRGFAFLGASVSITLLKSLIMWQSDSNSSYSTIRSTALIAQIGLRIWSAIDANRIAKVNNLAYRDRYKLNFSLQVSPFIGWPGDPGKSKSLPAGLTLVATF